MIRRMAGREIFERVVQNSRKNLDKLYVFLRLVSTIEIDEGMGERQFRRGQIESTRF